MMRTIIHLFFHSCIFIFFLNQVVEGKVDKELLGKLEKSQSQANTLYIENKGQIGDQDGKPNPAVKYLILRPGLNIQLKANSFSYDAYTIERFKRVEQLPEPVHHKFDKQDDDSLVYHFNRVDIELVDANPSPRITQEGASSDYLNYYTHITSQTNGEEGATGVRGYSSITYYDIYPNIDLEWFLDNNGKPEYQFIINPGGDPSNIRLKYHGAQKTELISDAIHIHIKPGIIKEHIPVSYLKESKENVQISFIKLSNNEYGFEYPKYASNETLVIDPVPNRLWGTYYGGSGEDIIWSVDTDVSGNIILGGHTESNINIASSGAWDVVLSGTRDAFIAKFNSSGSRSWGTYFGGIGNELLFNLVIDNSSNIYFTGYTNSSNDISSVGVWDSTLNGTFDAFLAKFSSSGTRFWSTYYGGSQTDYGGALATDLSGNVYLGGSTSSPTDIATQGTWDVSYGGSQDLFLVKFNSSGIRIWGTYCGGSGIEQSFIALAVDASGNVYLSGCTNSTTDIASSGAWDDTYGGNDDAFLVKFNSSGSRLWGTYFGGQNKEWIYYHSLTVDEIGDVILGGLTQSFSDIASSGAWDESKNLGDDIFLVKFSASGLRLWGTYYGGNVNEHIRGLQTDFNGNIYITGSTTSSSDISSIGSWDEVYGGNGDGFLAKFSSSGTRIWGTYYGGSNDDMGIALAINNSENLFIVGYTSSNTSISSIGAWDETFGGNNDGFIIKFGPENQITTPSLSSNSYCQNQEFSLPYTVTGTYTAPNTFTAQLSNANGSFTNPTTLGTVSAIVSGTIACRIPIGIPAGTGYRIRIVSSNPSVISSDNGSNITINPMPIPVITGDKNTCVSTQSVSYTVTQIPGHTYLWQSVSKGEIIGSATGNSVSVRWNATGTDTIKVRQTITATGCFKDTMFVVTIQGAPTPQITGSGSVCQSNTTLQSYSISQVSGDAYLWFPPIKGEIVGNASGNSVQIKWTSSGTDTVRVRQTNGLTGCFKDTLLIVTINPVPNPSITGEKIVCAKISQYQYTVPLIAGHTYEWTFPTKGSVKGSRTNNTVIVTWNTSGSDTLKVRQTNTTTGCFKDTSIIVNVSELPSPKITGEQSICLSSSPSTFTVNQIPGYSIEWEKPRLGSIVSYKLNAVSIIWNASGTDSVRVKIKDNLSGCERDTILRVMIMKSPEPLITGDARACENQSPKVYRVQKQSGRTYSWSKPKNGIIIGSSASDSISVQWVNSGSDTLRMEERDNTTNCTKDTSFIVSIAPLPDATIIGSSQVRENEQGITYSVKNESGFSYDWSIVSGDATIAGKTGNSVTLNAGKPGTVKLNVKVTNQNGCMSESELSITVKSLTSIREISSAPFTLYPNPAGDHLYVKMDAEITGDIHIELYDVLGHRHYKQTYQSTEIIRIPVQSLSQGMYMIKVKTSQDEYMERFVK